MQLGDIKEDLALIWSSDDYDEAVLPSYTYLNVIYGVNVFMLGDWFYEFDSKKLTSFLLSVHFDNIWALLKSRLETY